MTDRLDRIEAILETTVRENAELRSTVTALVQIVELHQRNHEVAQRNFDAIVTKIGEMQSEIRGLQTENRRILDRIFGPTGDNGESET